MPSREALHSTRAACASEPEPCSPDSEAAERGTHAVARPRGRCDTATVSLLFKRTLLRLFSSVRLFGSSSLFVDQFDFASTADRQPSQSALYQHVLPAAVAGCVDCGCSKSTLNAPPEPTKTSASGAAPPAATFDIFSSFSSSASPAWQPTSDARPRQGRQGRHARLRTCSGLAVRRVPAAAGRASVWCSCGGGLLRRRTAWKNQGA